MTQELDRAQVRLFVYRRFVKSGGSPSISDIVESFGVDRNDARRSLRSLAEAPALVLDPDTDEVRRALPFSALPTSLAVRSGESSWWDDIGFT